MMTMATKTTTMMIQVNVYETYNIPIMPAAPSMGIDTDTYVYACVCVFRIQKKPLMILVPHTTPHHIAWLSKRDER